MDNPGASKAQPRVKNTPPLPELRSCPTRFGVEEGSEGSPTPGCAPLATGLSISDTNGINPQLNDIEILLFRHSL
jgi:hypothetical protein